MRKTVTIVLAMLIAVLGTGCSKGMARIDYTMSGNIVWPGQPEKPRIRYLWSLYRVIGDAGFERLAGALEAQPQEGQAADPRDSAFLVRPNGLFVDASGMLYIADTGAGRVNIIDLKTMESRMAIGGRDFYLSAPISVVASKDGSIFVTDAEARRLAVFDSKGRFMRLFADTFERPTGLAIDEQRGYIYVSDTWGHCVYKYDLEGRRLGRMGGEGPGRGLGALNYPTHLAVDGAGNLLVADTLNFRIQVFSPEGGAVDAFGLAGDSFDSFDKIKGVALDTEGHVYATDSGQDMVKIFDRQGRLLLFFGGGGHMLGQFNVPTGIYIDRMNRIFVSDTYNKRVQAFEFLGGQ